VSTTTGEYSQVTKNQIERARQIDVLDYALKYEHENVKRVGGTYRMKDHPSIEIKSGKWRWYSQGLSGKTALDFLIDVRGYGLVDAVCLLLNETPQCKERPDKAASYLQKQNTMEEKPPPERLPFALPRRNNNNNRAIAYLQSRGIDRDLIIACIDRDTLYESAYRHDIIFMGKDERGKTRYAAIRSTTSGFKGETAGSDKRYSFLLLPSDPDSRTVAAFESAVDSLSHQTMCKQGYIPPFDGWRLSLGGTSVSGLEHFLSRNPQVTHCFVGTDNDNAGNRIAVRVERLPNISVERIHPIQGTDWNNALQAVQKAERTKNRAYKSAREERG